MRLLILKFLNFKTFKVIERLGDVELTFIFRGNILKSDVPLKSQGVKKGSVIQVVKTGPKEAMTKQWPKFTEREVQEVIWMYRSITASNFHKASRPEFLKKVLEKYPILRNNLSAISILKDPVLLATLGHPDTIRRMAEENRELIDATKFIVDTLNSKSAPLLNFGVDPADDLDSSSSSDEPTMASTSRGAHRRITSTQLAQALGQVFAGGTNSLANISQRNLGEGTPSAEGTSTSSNSSTPNRITSSMFLNALSEVLRSTRSNNEVRNLANAADTTENADNSATGTTPRAEANSSQPPLYLQELQQMRDMGLTDTELCLQALMVCNGDLETAVNLVLSGGGIN